MVTGLLLVVTGEAGLQRRVGRQKGAGDPRRRPARPSEPTPAGNAAGRGARRRGTRGVRAVVDHVSGRSQLLVEVRRLSGVHGCHSGGRDVGAFFGWRKQGGGPGQHAAEPWEAGSWCWAGESRGGERREGEQRRLDFGGCAARKATAARGSGAGARPLEVGEQRGERMRTRECGLISDDRRG